MLQTLRRHLPIVLTAVVTAAVFAAGPTVARAAYDAVNSDKVDGKHAVGAGASVTNRKGKLVATNNSGVLPNNIIAKAPDADTLDGIDSTSFLPVTGKAADADTLDGIDSTDFLGASGKAADSDRLDGLDAAEFDRPMTFGVETISATLAGGGNYVLSPPFTTSLSGMCMVTVSGQITGYNTGYGPNMANSAQRGTTDPFRDLYDSQWFVSHTSTVTPAMSRSTILRVNAGQPTRVGAFIGDVAGEWIGDQFRANVTYLCSTAGVIQ